MKKRTEERLSEGQQYFSFAEQLAKLLEISGVEASDIASLLQEIYGLLLPAIKEAFEPIKRDLLSVSLSLERRRAWASFCFRLHGDQRYPGIRSWNAWDQKLGAAKGEKSGIFGHFKAATIQVLETSMVTQSIVGASDQLMEISVSRHCALDELLGSHHLSGIFYGEAAGNRDGKRITFSADSGVSYLLDCLFDRLINDERDAGVFALFKEACDFKALSDQLPAPSHQMPQGGMRAIAHPGSLAQSLTIHDMDEEKEPLPQRSSMVQLSLHAKSLLDTDESGYVRLFVSPGSSVDMSTCSLLTYDVVILSATGSCDLPDTFEPEDGQLVVLGLPVEKVIPPPGFSVIAPITSADFHAYYEDRSEAVIKNLRINTYHFLDKLDLFGISFSFFGMYLSLLENSSPQMPWSWYNHLLTLCGAGRIPVSKLRNHYTSGALDLRSHPVELLPLPESALQKHPEMTEEIPGDDSSEYARQTGRMLDYVKQGFNLVNQDSWRILYLEGVTKERFETAFRFERKDYHGRPVRLEEELDLREMHPEFMKTLPPRSAVTLPLGLDNYYRDSLTREYDHKFYQSLAIGSLGLSRLAFYILHDIRTRMLLDLPESSRDEIRAILAHFKWRRITEAARDYLYYTFSSLIGIDAMPPMKQEILFGKLPDRNHARYFSSMRYLPLFQTRRNLERFVDKAFTGRSLEKAERVSIIVQQVSGVTPWKMNISHTEQERSLENSRMLGVMLMLVSAIVKHSKLRKEFAGRLLQPENVYFLGLLLAEGKLIHEKVLVISSHRFFARLNPRSSFVFDFLALSEAFSSRKTRDPAVIDSACKWLACLPRVMRELSKREERSRKEGEVRERVWTHSSRAPLLKGKPGSQGGLTYLVSI